MKEMIISVIIIVIFYGIVMYFGNKLLTRLRIKRMERVADEMVEAGEITREEAVIVKWIVNYKPIKK